MDPLMEEKENKRKVNSVVIPRIAKCVKCGQCKVDVYGECSCTTGQIFYSKSSMSMLKPIKLPGKLSLDYTYLKCNKNQLRHFTTSPSILDGRSLDRSPLQQRLDDEYAPIFDFENLTKIRRQKFLSCKNSALNNFNDFTIEKKLTIPNSINPFSCDSNDRSSKYVKWENRLNSEENLSTKSSQCAVDIEKLEVKVQSEKDAESRKADKGDRSNFRRFKLNKLLLQSKIKACNFSLFFAVLGLALTILEAELIANGYTTKDSVPSVFLRYLIVLSTLFLLLWIIWYHVISVKMCTNNYGLEDWCLAITSDRVAKLSVEILICSVCPFPNNVYIDWIVLKDDHRQTRTVQVPLDIVLSIPMFLRVYLLCRYLALRSNCFQDAIAKSIASLNRVTLNFSFVLKTMINEHPLRTLCSFTICFCVATAWLLTQCERFAGIAEDNNYLNSLWFVIITFKSVGYGDIVPNTYCGRVLAITTGVVGAIVSSTLIAVIGMKLELTKAEKQVNIFMKDSKLHKQVKNCAASVLQNSWLIHKYNKLQSGKDKRKLRSYQKKFISAVEKFRTVKCGQRKLAEQTNVLVDLVKLQNNTNTMMCLMQQTLDDLIVQMEKIKTVNS